ncbi:MAG TPA: hypothetical protein VFG69_19220 [Nannocystaceae bacterium]|nr:hypothetical protein [Nannocystaceae bacterium]
MTAAVLLISTLLDMSTGRASADDGPARRTQLTIAASLATLAFAALWGVAAGSTVGTLAIANALKVPMVVLLSAVAAIPAGMLALRLMGLQYPARDLVHAFAPALFAGTLALAVTAPLVALYYHTSVWAGPYLAMGSAALAIVVAGLLFARGAVRRATTERERTLVMLPVVVTIGFQLATMLQLVALASPILPETTLFDTGVDVLAR